MSKYSRWFCSNIRRWSSTFEYCGGGQWRFLWCIIMRLPKKSKRFVVRRRLKNDLFSCQLGESEWVKTLAAFRWLKPRKPETGLAPISLRQETTNLIILPASSAHLYLLVFFCTVHSPEVNSTLVPHFKSSLRIIYLCVFVLPFVICPASAGSQRSWQIQYCSLNLVSNSSDSYSTLGFEQAGTSQGHRVTEPIITVTHMLVPILSQAPYARMHPRLQNKRQSLFLVWDYFPRRSRSTWPVKDDGSIQYSRTPLHSWFKTEQHEYGAFRDAHHKPEIQ